jgi:hypothetical protein
VAARALKEEALVNELLQRFTMINDTVSGYWERGVGEANDLL